MRAHSKLFSTTASCLLFCFAMTSFGLPLGCGSTPPQATLDDEAKARVQGAIENKKKFMEKVRKDDVKVIKTKKASKG